MKNYHEISHRILRLAPLGLLTVTTFAPCLFADEAENIRLIHRTPTPVSMSVHTPLLFDVRGNSVLYGDKEIIERLVPNENGGFIPDGLFVCELDRMMLDLENGEEWVVVGESDGLEILASDDDGIRSVGSLRDDQRHLKVEVEGELIVSLCNDDPRNNSTGTIFIHNAADIENIELLGEIEGEYELISLHDNLLAAFSDSIHVYDLSDPAEPRLASILPPPSSRGVLRLTWCGNILAMCMPFEDGIRFFNLENPDEPTALRPLGGEVWAIQGEGNFIAYFQEELILADIADPDNPLVLMTLPNERDDPYFTTSIRFLDQDMILLNEGVPDCIYRIEDEAEGRFRISQRYYPPFEIRQIERLGNQLFFLEEYKLTESFTQANGQPDLRFRPYWSSWGFFGYFYEMEFGDNWLALTELGDGQSTLHLFRANGENRIRHFYSGRQAFEDPMGSNNMLLIDNRLAIKVNRTVWRIYNVDQDGNPQQIGQTELPLSSAGVSRDGFLYCLTSGVFHIFNTGNLPDIEEVAQLEIAGDRPFLHRNTIYITGLNGIIPVDVADPGAPEALDLYQMDLRAGQMAFSGNTAVVTNSDGLVTLDVSNPAQISQLGFYYPEGRNREDEIGRTGFTAVAVNGDLLYAGGGYWTNGLYTLHFDRADEAPGWIDPPVAIEVAENERIFLNLRAEDLNRDSLTLSALNLPEGSNFTDRNDGSGLFTWQTDFDDAGEYAPVFVVSDGELTDTAIVRIRVNNVNRPPIFDWWLESPPDSSFLPPDSLIEFRWTRAVPAGTDSVNYILYLEGLNGLHSLDADTMTSVQVNRERLLGWMEGGELSWWVTLFYWSDSSHCDRSFTLFPPLDAPERLLAPHTLHLVSAYPNPFNSSTTISYTIPQANWTTMDILDIHGRLVERLSEGWMAAGNYRIVWDAKGETAGYYFVELRSGIISSRIPIILIK